MPTFVYNEMTFEPVRQFTKKENKLGLKLPFRSIGISTYKNNYDYDQFYQQAASIDAGNIDVFKCDKGLVVPCSNELFGLD